MQLTHNSFTFIAICPVFVFSRVMINFQIGNGNATQHYGISEFRFAGLPHTIMANMDSLGACHKKGGKMKRSPSVRALGRLMRNCSKKCLY